MNFWDPTVSLLNVVLTLCVLTQLLTCQWSRPPPPLQLNVCLYFSTMCTSVSVLDALPVPRFPPQAEVLLLLHQTKQSNTLSAHAKKCISCVHSSRITAWRPASPPLHFSARLSVTILHLFACPLRVFARRLALLPGEPWRRPSCICPIRP